MDLFSQASNYWGKLETFFFIPLLASVLTLLVAYSIYPAFWVVVLVVIIFGANIVVWMQHLFTFLVRLALKRQANTFSLPLWYKVLSVIAVVIFGSGTYVAFQMDPTTTYPQLITDAKFAAITLFGVIKICVTYWMLVGKLVEKNWHRIKGDEVLTSDFPALS